MKRTDVCEKIRKPSIRLVLTATFILFTVIGLLMLFLFQTFFLDDLYEYIKIGSIQNAVTDIAAVVGTDSLEDTIEYWDIKEGCQVYIMRSDGKLLYEDAAIDAGNGRFSTEMLQYYYTKAKQQGGEYSELDAILLNGVGEKREKPFPGGGLDGPEKPTPPPNSQGGLETNERILYALISIDETDGAEYMTLVTAAITPVDATVRTLNIQFLIAAVVLTAFAIVLSIIISRIVAGPIVRLNRAAKDLGRQQYAAPVEGLYREVQELNRTLSAVSVELQKSEQLQRDLIANVSHDLRTPLTMIMGYSEAIRDLPGEDSAENIQVVIDEASRLTHLVNDVLDLSKLQSGTQQVDLIPLDLTEMVEEVSTRCRRMTEAEGYRIEFIYDTHVCVRADEVRISQVIYNLLCNALAHTGDDRRVVISQTVTENRVRISFSDSGKGIPPEVLDKIWLRYYQVHSDDKRRAMSSGLGLSIVHAVVRLHGGECGVESEVGKGSTFWFELAQC